MKSAFESFWFWILLLGLLLILVGALIAGGTKEFSGWVWGLFIAGIVIALIGLLIGILSWNSNRATANVLPCPKITDMQVNEGCNSYQASPMYSPAYSPMYSPASPASPAYSPTYSNKSLTANSINPQISLNENISSSPPMVPTKVSTNIPQAQRGFATTSLNLSALSPNS
jgi:hypothetical protein